VNNFYIIAAILMFLAH